MAGNEAATLQVALVSSGRHPAIYGWSFKELLNLEFQLQQPHPTTSIWLNLLFQPATPHRNYFEPLISSSLGGGISRRLYQLFPLIIRQVSTAESTNNLQTIYK